MSSSVLRRATLFLASALGALAIFAPGAFAAGPPILTVSAPAANEITLTSADIRPSINPNGATGTYKVEYGKTTSYGKTSFVNNFNNAGESPVEFRVPIYGLEAMSTYHFQVVATNKYGTTKSGDIQFENMKDWKVEGKRVTEMGELVSFSGKTATLEFQGSILKVGTRVVCNTSETTSGKLGIEYNGLKHFSCFTQFGGISYDCKGEVNPNFDRNLQQVGNLKITLFGTDCPVGSLTLQNVGFRVEPTLEATTFTNGLWGEAYLNTTTEGHWDVALYNNQWSLTGTNAGKKFGVS